MEVKRCPKCSQTKTVEEFHKQKTTKDGLARLCKLCYKVLRDDWKKRKENKNYFKEHYNANREKILKESAEWKEKNKEHVVKVNKEWYDKNRDRALDKSREWKENNKEQATEKNKEWYEENKERIHKVQRKYREENKDLIWKRELEYRRKRRKNDPKYKLIGNLRSRLRSALRAGRVTKVMHTIELLGCSPKFLVEYLEKQFKEGMTRKNYGKVWQVDHIVACSKFDLTIEEEQRKCFHFTNLQPLFIEEHKKKSIKDRKTKL